MSPKLVKKYGKDGYACISMTVAEPTFTKPGAPKLQCAEICFRVENNLVPLLGIEPLSSLTVQPVAQSPHRMVCPIYNV